MSEGTLYIVGTGPGTSDYLTAEARGIIGRCRFFAGGRRQLQIAPAGAETCVIGADLEAVRRFIEARLPEGDVCVLASGDPGCYSILTWLSRHFNGQISVSPGLSSVQLLAARLKTAWQDWRIESLHGRKAWKVAPPVSATVYLCDSSNTPQALARMLLEEMSDCPAAVGAGLGTPDERLFEGSLFDVAAGQFPGHSLLLVLPDEEEASPPFREGPGESAPGIPDHLWRRREGVPLSKSEVRSVLLSLAQPSGRGVIWDVGAGSGSYAIECALLSPAARVIAIERRPEAAALITGNAGLFGAGVEVVIDDAPECFAGLPAPDLVIVGGSDGCLEEIFTAAVAVLNPGGRIVVTAVLKETAAVAPRLFANAGLTNRQTVRVAISRAEGEEWTDNNPVTIFTGDKSQ